MDEFKVNEEHAADTKLIGFDYQFLYFLYLILDLNTGEKLGFEILDDIHIECPNGNIVLLQTKHTVQKNAKGDQINLTERDSDLWKTINNWILFIEASEEIETFLIKTSFKLVTNKSIKTNLFIENILKFQAKKLPPRL